MAMHYTVSVYVDGINRTAQTVMPIKLGEFLDERLDEGHITLKAVKTSNIAPLTPVEIRIKQDEYRNEWSNNPQIIASRTSAYYYVVSDDSATELTPGSGLYNHELGLIEITKAAERVVVDTLTYTNDLGKVYAGQNEYAEPVWE